MSHVSFGSELFLLQGTCSPNGEVMSQSDSGLLGQCLWTTTVAFLGSGETLAIRSVVEHTGLQLMDQSGSIARLTGTFSGCSEGF